jgi:hypothetical protein
MKLVEPFKSAQSFFFWKGGCSNDITQDGDRTYYKVVKKGFFFRKRVLLVWKQLSKKWKPSSHLIPPLSSAYEGVLIEIEDEKKKRLQLQKEDFSERNLSKEDRDWSREQALFIAEKAVQRNRRLHSDKERREALKNNNVDKVIDAFIHKNRTSI